MSTLTDLLAEHTDLSGAVAGHLQRVVAEWQLLADLSFADLLMVVDAADDGLICVAQCRPNTASTVYPVDQVGRSTSPADDPLVAEAIPARRIVRGPEPTVLELEVRRESGPIQVQREAVPVTFDGEVVAVVTRTANLAQLRLPSSLEMSYRDCADDLSQMLADGTFPQNEGNPRGLSTPRAGDGFIRIDTHGVVAFASPNALSAVHRMGWTADLTGNRLVDVMSELLTDRFEAEEVVGMITDAVAGRSGMRTEADARRATVLLRAVPLHPEGRPAGAAVLLRDVTELKRRDRALISKDATIREIHHRVKNNLQSVSALLRLQARRTDNPEARGALNEAVRRVAAIALVHELLSGSVDEAVDLDVVVDQLVPVLADVAAGDGQAVVRRAGRLGVLPSDLAMPMVMVLTELIQNAVEHGFADGDEGEVVIDADRNTRRLVVAVRDDGVGLPEGFDLRAAERLGLQIVHTLVRIELGGTLELSTRPEGGTQAVLTVPLR
ncbi:MAG: histidine kinase N-terminal domain-containing protein [Williamsia herbipolensis]|uniref:histidine kinase n=1 Tax=Williamsia serinedens TaxID=391736 RepID=A0ABT1H6B6_9NOCA|nr:PAS domain-containing sensor histidine kinase [Williamsia serinedens]MBE7161418.1 histidine kinase N-terminal domain-containing protein [Williamsia herbipolensis]MCP2161303.1 Two-component sensor histidine kinase, contains HisKA and HATPase domains [Williamsia serinedens]